MARQLMARQFDLGQPRNESNRASSAVINTSTGKNTQVESGLGTSTVTIQQYSNPYLIKITVAYGTLRHYLVFRYGNSNVYLLTNKADDSVTVQRYIVRLPSGLFSHTTADADYEDASTVVIEAQDVNEDTSDGYTFSKHYSGYQYGRWVPFLFFFSFFFLFFDRRFFTSYVPEADLISRIDQDHRLYVFMNHHHQSYPPPQDHHFVHV